MGGCSGVGSGYECTVGYVCYDVVACETFHLQYFLLASKDIKWQYTYFQLQLGLQLDSMLLIDLNSVASQFGTTLL